MGVITKARLQGMILGVGIMMIGFLLTLYLIIANSSVRSFVNSYIRLSEYSNHPIIKSTKGEHHEEGGRNFVKLNAEAIQAASIHTEQAKRESSVGTLSVTAVIKPNENRLIHVNSRIQGRLEKVYALLGEEVKAGGTLALLDSVELGIAITDFLKAKGNLEVAEANYKRELRLFEKKTVSERSMLEAKAHFLTVESDYRGARGKLLLYDINEKAIDRLSWDHKNHISHSPIIAPISGTVVDKSIALGEVVSPDKTLYTIADLSTVWIILDIYEKDIPNIHPGQRCLIQSEAYPNQIFQGYLTYISDLVDEETRTMKVRVEIKNQDRLLKPGMFVTAHLTEEGNKRNLSTLTVPYQAIQRIEGEEAIFIQIGENRFAKRLVRLGRRWGEKVEVLEGLSEGERVVTEGGFWLKSELLREQMGKGDEH